MKKIVAALVMGVLLMTAGVFAFAGSEKSSKFSEERHAAMQEAFENLDYDAWRDLMNSTGKGNKRMLQVVTEDNFAEFAEAHKAALEGDFSKMHQFRETYGLGMGLMKQGYGKAMQKMHKGGCMK